MRYICTKELVHLLDESFFSVDTPEKLHRLMIGMTTDLVGVFQTVVDKQELTIDVSCLADYAAQWLAIPVLVPPSARARVIAKYRANELSDHDVAYFFRIPQKFVPYIASDMYDQFVDKILSAAKMPAEG